MTSSIVPVDTGFAPLQDAHMIREYCSVDNLNTIEQLTDGTSYDLQDMVSFLIYDDLFDADLQRRVLFESLSLLKDLCSSVLASGCGDLVPAIFWGWN